ncbi:MAG: FecR domain-containing protein [Deltaproteobacteria bacterium]
MDFRPYLCIFLAAVFFLCPPSARAEMLMSQETPASVEGAMLVSAEGTAAGRQESAEAADVPQVEVIALEGDVQIKPEAGAYAPAEEGALLEAGTTIKTGKDASVELGFDEADKNIVRVDENTTAVLLLDAREKINLLEGAVFSIINDLPAGASFEIRTPTAVAGARGTEWATLYRDGTTEVEALADVPYVRGFDESGKALDEAVDIKPGFMRSVRRAQAPAGAVRLSDAKRLGWNRMKQDMNKRVRAVRQQRGFPQRDPGKKGRLKDKAGPGETGRKAPQERAAQGPGKDGQRPAGPGGTRRGEGASFRERVEKGDAWRERIKDQLPGQDKKLLEGTADRPAGDHGKPGRGLRDTGAPDPGSTAREEEGPRRPKVKDKEAGDQAPAPEGGVKERSPDSAGQKPFAAGAAGKRSQKALRPVRPPAR